MSGFWRRIIWLLPLAAFIVLLFVMAGNLGKSPEVIVRSHMIGKPVPEFTLAGYGDRPGLASADLARGEPVLVNLYASWCLPCIVEAPQLAVLKARGATIQGIAVRDTEVDMQDFLDRYGDAYDRIGNDAEGRMLVAFGASGVPETYVVDGRGIIRYQHLGEIRSENVAELLTQLEKAR